MRCEAGWVVEVGKISEHSQVEFTTLIQRIALDLYIYDMFCVVFLYCLKEYNIIIINIILPTMTYVLFEDHADICVSALYRFTHFLLGWSIEREVNCGWEGTLESLVAFVRLKDILNIYWIGRWSLMEASYNLKHDWGMAGKGLPSQKTPPSGGSSFSHCASLGSRCGGPQPSNNRRPKGCYHGPTDLVEFDICPDPSFCYIATWVKRSFVILVAFSKATPCMAAGG